MIALTEFQMWLTTADEERIRFSGDQFAQLPAPDPESALPAGRYRVIDGRLFRVLPGYAPASEAT